LSPKRFGLEEDVDGWAGSTQDFLRLENRSTFHRLSQSDARTTFFFVWQAEFDMCFGVAPSAYHLPFSSCGTHFPIF